MHYVYIIQSQISSNRYYIGSTKNLDNRLKQHNAGEGNHTSKYAPWQRIVTIAFTEKNKALKFERYLKSGSGRAFAKRHF
jgi:putative endonuclease